MNEELSDLYLKLKESGELENIFHLEDIRQIVETNISKIAGKTT